MDNLSFINSLAVMENMSSILIAPMIRRFGSTRYPNTNRITFQCKIIIILHKTLTAFHYVPH